MKYETAISQNTLNIRLQGEFTFTDNEEFQGMAKVIEASTQQAISLDMGQLEFIDSAALSMLLVLREGCAKQKKQLSIRNSQGRVKEVLEEMKFTKFIKTTS